MASLFDFVHSGHLALLSLSIIALVWFGRVSGPFTLSLPRSLEHEGSDDHATDGSSTLIESPQTH